MNCHRCENPIGLVHLVVLKGDEPGRHYCASCGPVLEDVPPMTVDGRIHRARILEIAQRRIDRRLERRALAEANTTWRRPSWKQ